MAEFHTPIYEELVDDLDTTASVSAGSSAYDAQREQTIIALEQGTLSAAQELATLGRLAAEVSQDYN